MATQTTYRAQVALARRLDGLSLVLDVATHEAVERRLISLVKQPRLRSQLEHLNALEALGLREAAAQFRASDRVLDQLEHELSGNEKAPSPIEASPEPKQRVLAANQSSTNELQLPLFGGDL